MKHISNIRTTAIWSLKLEVRSSRTRFLLFFNYLLIAFFKCVIVFLLNLGHKKNYTIVNYFYIAKGFGFPSLIFFCLILKLKTTLQFTIILVIQGLSSPYDVYSIILTYCATMCCDCVDDNKSQ